MMLTAQNIRAYAPSADGVPSARFYSLREAARSRIRNVCGFFIALACQFMAGRAGEPQGSPVLPRSVNPVRSVTYRFTAMVAENKPQWRKHFMNALRDKSIILSRIERETASDISPLILHSVVSALEFEGCNTSKGAITP